MQRREFGGTLVAGAIGAGAPRRNSRMHAGGDYHSVAGAGIASKENLEYNLRFGVKHLTAQLRKRASGGGWDLDEMKRMRDDCEKSGVTLEAIRMDADYIALRPAPERDRELDIIAGNIRKAAQVGVQVITYHWTAIPIRRNRQTRGRGGVTYAGFKLEDNWKDLPAGKAGRISSDDYWERIAYFLTRIIPAAREHDVRMACHPYDPPGLPFGYQGADNWDSPSVFAAIQRYEAVVESPYNGFQLCLGTAAEGLKNPKAEILPIVRYLGERGKLFQIHMRNIRGGLHAFEEVFPDEGEMDFFAVMRILRDTGFGYSICPDHMPRHPGDPGSLQSFAFSYGYIQALIQAVNSEVRG
ncbi:MAG: mannonate dehydratase [Acidobacteria bacterium]|nr:mannonate dehydratase [Acidobacteriota bacterium]